MQQLLSKYLSTLNLANLTKHKYCTRTLTLEIAIWVLKQTKKWLQKMCFTLLMWFDWSMKFRQSKNLATRGPDFRWNVDDDGHGTFFRKTWEFFTQKLYTNVLKLVWKWLERNCLEIFLIMISQCNSHVLNEKDAFKVIRIWPRFVAQVLPELWNFSKSGKFERHDLLLRSFENKVR